MKRVPARPKPLMINTWFASCDIRLNRLPPTGGMHTNRNDSV